MTTYKLKRRSGRGSRNKRTSKKIKKGGVFGFSNKKQKIISKDDKHVFTCPNVNIKCQIRDYFFLDFVVFQFRYHK